MKAMRRFAPAVAPLEARRLQTSLAPRLMQLTGGRGRTVDMILIPPGANLAAARAEWAGSLGPRGTQAVVVKMVNSGAAVIVPILNPHVFLMNGPVKIEVGTGKFVRNVKELEPLPGPLREALRDEHKWNEWVRFVNG
jgi:hypothetical protein